jgi:hypothetical protein
VTQEDFEFAIAKVRRPTLRSNVHPDASVLPIGVEEEPGRKHIRQQVVLIVELVVYTVFYDFAIFVESGAQDRHPDIEYRTHVATFPSVRHTFYTHAQHRCGMVNACPSLLATGVCQTANCTQNHLIKFCESCRLVCQDVHSYASHLGGRGHATKLKSSAVNVLCTTCDRNFAASSWDSHVRGQKHLKASQAAGIAPQIQAEEGRPPPGSLHCRLCNSNVRIDGWGTHQSGPAHRKKEQYFLLKAVFDVAINDKGSAVILPPEELDFEAVEPADARQGVTKQLVIQVTDPSVSYKIVQVAIAGSQNKRNTA